MESDRRTFLGVLVAVVCAPLTALFGKSQQGGCHDYIPGPADGQPLVVDFERQPKTIRWTGAASKHWGDPLNWDGGVVPTDGDSIELIGCDGVAECLMLPEDKPVSLNAVMVSGNCVLGLGCNTVLCAVMDYHTGERLEEIEQLLMVPVDKPGGMYHWVVGSPYKQYVAAAGERYVEAAGERYVEDYTRLEKLDAEIRWEYEHNPPPPNYYEHGHAENLMCFRRINRGFMIVSPPLDEASRIKQLRCGGFV